MKDDPFLDLILEALNLCHPRFALAFGSEYSPGDALAKRRERERPFLCEFYHQFRHLWERGLPGRLGLGHLVVQGEPKDLGPLPDLLFWRLGEAGQPDQRTGAVSLSFLTNPETIADNGELLSRFQREHGYPMAVSVVVGAFSNSEADALPSFAGVTYVRYDTQRRQARA